MKQAIFCWLIAGLFVSSLVIDVNSMTNAEISDKVIRQMLLSPDGKEVDFEVLAELAEQLVTANNAAKLKKSQRAEQERPAKSTNINKATSSLALNDYLTVGRQPSTTKFLGLSSMCDICASIVKVGGEILVLDTTWPKAVALAKRLCPGLTGTSDYVCNGYVENFEVIVHHAMKTMIQSPYSMCNWLFSNLGCGSPDHQHFLWEIALPDPPPNPIPPPSSDPTIRDKLRILLMTDLHIDPDYAVGSPARCMEPMCCRNASTPIHDPIPNNERAGYWGDYRLCDLPWWTFDDMLHHANITHGDDIDFIFVAGDLPPHDTWNQSASVHMDVIDKVAEKIAANFPEKPVFFAVGNHEVVPMSNYPLEQDPKQFSIQWLYDKLADVWMKWLDPTISNATVRYAGFYTVRLKSGLRLVTINDNYCLRQNFFLFAHANISDPYGHLKWLVDILTESEKIGERVIILGHIPPGHDECLQAWGWNYYRIISRFANIIVGQFFGHRHKDYFVMYYDAETLMNPKSVAFVGPPGTPFGRNNIGYRIYEFDPVMFELTDFHTWYTDIEEANANGNTQTMPWKLEYSATSAYGLSDMSADSWSDFASRMQTDFALFNKYRKHYTLSVDDVLEPCGTECRRFRLCEAYQGLAYVTDEWCERWVPSKKSQSDEDASLRKCSARFLKRPDLN